MLIVWGSTSDDVVVELTAVSNSLLAQNVFEDGDDDVIGEVGGVFDDAVSEEEDDSDILEAVAGEHEGNTGVFNSISDHGVNFLFNSAGFVNRDNVFNEGEEFSLGFNILGVLGLVKKVRLSVQRACFQSWAWWIPFRGFRIRQFRRRSWFARKRTWRRYRRRGPERGWLPLTFWNKIISHSIKSGFQYAEDKKKSTRNLYSSRVSIED